MKPTRSGPLRHTVTIQSNAPTQNGVGEPVEVWTNFGMVYASVEPMSGGETFVSNQRQAIGSHLITIRYLLGVKANMRVLFNGQIYDILFVRNIEERNRLMGLYCLLRDIPDVTIALAGVAATGAAGSLH